MAKAKVAAKGVKTAKCECNLGLVLIALILISLALYGIVQGFALQLQAVQAGTQAYGMILV